MPRLLRLSLLLLLPACGTLTTGTSQSVSVTTEPPGATCTLTRRGEVVGMVNPTPGTVTVSKSSSDIEVRCTRTEHVPGSGVLGAEFQAMTAGNILIGGGIGLVIDAASGAIARYPDSIVVVLPPEAFASAAARDSYYDARIADARRSFAERITAARGSCSQQGGPADPCLAKIEGLNRAEAEEIERLEGFRREARITG